MSTRIVKNLIGILLLIWLGDAFVFRDPFVELPGNYRIIGTAANLPCQLSPRFNSEAEWVAMKDDGEFKFRVLNRKNEESISANSIDEIGESLPLDNVDVYHIAPRVDDVTEYTNNKSFVAGKSATGYFLLELKTHKLDTWVEYESWKRSAIAAGLSPSPLYSPDSLFQQTRPPVVIAIYVGMLTLAVAVPILNRNHD